MIIFLYGKDSYQLKQNLDKIVEEYRKKYSGLSYAVLDVSEHGKFALLEDTVKTVSFFDEKRLVVVKNCFDLADRISSLIKDWDLAADKQRIIVFVENYSEEELNKKNKKLFTVLADKPDVVKNLELLTGKRLETWVVKELLGCGAKIEPDALNKLILCTDSDTWRLSQEINKLSNFCGNRLITSGDVELLVHHDDNLNIFQIVDAVAGRNKQRATVLLYDQLKAGEDPYYVFSMIVYQFRNLLRIKSLIKNAVPYAGIVKKTGLNPFVVKKTFDQCRGYDLDELRHLFTSLAQIDIEAKTSFIDMESSLY